MKNIVVIGCGAVLEQCHRKALQRIAPDVGWSVAGLVDPSRQRLEKAKRWFPSARCFVEPEACYEGLKDVRLTVITSPPPLHAAHAEIAFAHGSHALCEKPLAASLRDAERMVELSNRSNRILSLGMTRRFYPCLIEAWRRILGRSLGDNLTFSYREGGPYAWPVASPAPFYRQTSGGGVLLDKGVHALDSLVYLFGIGTVTSSADDGLVESVEANSVTELKLERASGTMQLSWDMNLNNGLHIRGSEGEYWIPTGPLDLLFSRESVSSEWRREEVHADWPLDLKRAAGKRGSPMDYNDCFNFQLVQTLRAIELGEPLAATGVEGLEIIRMLASAYAMSVPLVKPWLPANEQAFSTAHHWVERSEGA